MVGLCGFRWGEFWYGCGGMAGSGAAGLVEVRCGVVLCGKVGAQWCGGVWCCGVCLG